MPKPAADVLDDPSLGRSGFRPDDEEMDLGAHDSSGTPTTVRPRTWTWL